MSVTDQLVQKAKEIIQTAAEAEAQRRSFAYGNAKAENDRVTREMVDRAAEKHPRRT